MVGKQWSNTETEILTENYGKERVNEIQRAISDRTYMAIAAKAKRLKLHRPQHHSSKILVHYEKGFLEAALDGEGTIALYRNHNRCWHSQRGFHWISYVAITNTNYEFLEKIKEICGGGRLYLKTRKNTPRNQKAQYIYEMNRGVMKGILPQINLTIKEKQRRLLVEALRLIIHGGNSSRKIRETQILNDKRLGEIYIEMRVLNKRGVE